MSKGLYGLSLDASRVAAALVQDQLNLVTAHILIARYLLYEGSATDAALPLPMAFNLGLHRDGASLRLRDKHEAESRRRVWAMLYHLDRYIALQVGRPYFIRDNHVDTAPPLNLDDEELMNDTDPIGYPLSTPTKYTYVIAR